MKKQMISLFVFELSFFYKRVGIYLFLTAAIAFGGLTGSTISSLPSENTYQNSPFALTYTLGYVSLMWLFVVSILAAQVVLRERDSHFALVLYATPLRKIHYMLSRFLVVFGISLFSFFLFVLGFYVGHHYSRLGPDAFGPFCFRNYLQPFLLLGLPNLFLCSALICSIGWLSKNKLFIYTSGLFVYIGYMVAMLFSGSPLIVRGMPPTPEAMEMAAKLDPFGMSAFLSQTLTWSAVEKSNSFVSLTGTLLVNRLWIVLLSFGMLGVTFWKFSFSVSEKAKSTKSHIRKKNNLFMASHSGKPLSKLSAMASLLSLVNMDLKYVLKSMSFLLIAAGLGFHLSMEICTTIDRGIRLPEYYASSGLMVNTILDSFPALCSFVLLFYSSELIWRNRQHRFHLIEQATPTTATLQFFSKWLSLTALMLLLLILEIITGIVFQWVFHYVHIEWTAYMGLFYFVALPLITLAGIIALIQSLIPYKYVGLVLALVFMLAFTTNLGGYMGITHPLARFMSAYAGRYSDMNAYGHYAVSFAVKLVFGFSIVLLTVYVFLQHDQKRKKKFLLSVTFLSVATILPALYFNDHYHAESREAMLDWQEHYEKKYRSFQNSLQASVVSVKSVVDLFPEENRYHVLGEYVLVNKNKVPLQQVILSMDNRIQLKKMEVNEPSVRTADEALGHYRFDLSKPLQPGDSTRLNFEFTYSWNGFDPHQSFNAIVENGTFIRLSNYFPQMGYQPGNEIPDKQERKKRNLGDVSPVASLNSPGIAVDLVTVDMVISTEKDQTAIGTGELRGTCTRNGRRYFHYASGMRVPFHFGVSSARYSIAKKIHRGISIEIYYHPEHYENVERMIHNAVQTLDYCEHYFGNYPFKTIRFAEVSSFTRGFAGTAYPASIFMTEDMIFHTNLKGDKQQDVINELAGHELSHQWWGALQFTPCNMEGSKFLTETFAMYTELMLVKKMYGKQRVLDNVKMFTGMYLAERGFMDEQPLYKTKAENMHQHYYKGAVTMYQLSELIGEETLNKALRNVFQKYAHSPIAPVSTDFLEALYAVCDSSMYPKINDLFKCITTYNFEIADVSSVMKGTGYELTLKAMALKYHEDGKGHQTKMDFKDSVEVAVLFKNGKEKIYKVAVVKDSLLVKISVTEKPVEICIDPEEKFIKLGEGYRRIIP